MLAVSPGAQGTGVGIHHDVGRPRPRASREAFDAVVLSVVETNAPAAAFYRGLGYTRSPDRDWQPVPNITLQVWRRGVRPA